MPTPRSLDEVLADLMTTIDRLGQTSDIDERLALRRQLTDLRLEASAAREAAFAAEPDEVIEAEIARIDRALHDLQEARFRPDMVAGASGLGGGLDPLQSIRHNRAVDEAGGRAQLEKERSLLMEELERRSR